MNISDVLVLGGGFCGAMAAAHLARAGIHVTVLEPGELGRGVAYARTPHPLLLNTPASAMSAWPDAPAHFVDWLAVRGDSSRFASRANYGRYVHETVATTGGLRVEHVAARALAATRAASQLAVVADNGQRYVATHLVVALGNPPPRRPAAVESDHVDGYCADPYRAITELPCDDRTVCLVGSGLTALDVVVALRARGHRGRIVLVSRHGLVPLAHGTFRGTAALPPDLQAAPTLNGLVAWWRANTRDGCDGPPQIDVLRPHLPALWSRLPVADRRAFLRHVRARWDVIRHRAPPAVRAVFDAGRRDGSIDVHAARLTSVTRARGGLRVALSTGPAIDTAWLVNCAGPERDVCKVPSSLVQTLVDHRMVKRDELGLGVVTSPTGLASPGVHVVGPWRVADRWESTAVPELRGTVAATARAIAVALGVAATFAPAAALADDGTTGTGAGGGAPTFNDRVKVGTFIQADARYFGDDPAQDYVDTYTFRSLRLQVDAALNKDLDVRILPDFAGGKVVIQDAYVDVRYIPTITVRVGKQKVPFGLERLETEGTTMLAERGFPTQIAPNRDIGATIYGDPLAWLSWQLGVFNGEADGTLSDGDQTDQKEAAARVLFRPLPCWGKYRGLQLGGAVTYGTAEGTLASPDLPAYKSSGQTTFASFTAGTTVAQTAIADGRRERVTGQAMWFGGPIGAMTEYVRSVERVKLGAHLSDVTADAWQFAVQWVVTGDDATYNSVAPKHPLDPAKGDWGAVDVTARFDELRLGQDAYDNKILDEAKSAKRARGFTVGADWFWSKNVRLDLDLERTIFLGGAKTGNREHEDLILGRVQVVF